MSQHILYTRMVINLLEFRAAIDTRAQSKDLNTRQGYDYYFDDYPSEEYAAADTGYTTADTLVATAATGSASDLQDIPPATYASAGIGYSGGGGGGFNQNMIDQFNEKVAPGLGAGSAVDHSHDEDMSIKIDPWSEKYGGRTGVLVGDNNFKAGIYTDPLAPDAPAMFALEGSF